MKIVSGIFGGLILALILGFALSNREPIDIAMWPFDGAVTLPLYVAGFIPLILGLGFGALWGWLSAWPHRLRARRLHKEMIVLNAKLHHLNEASLNSVDVLSLRRKWWAWKR